MNNLMFFLLAMTACAGVSAEQGQRHDVASSPDVPAFAACCCCGTAYGSAVKCGYGSTALRATAGAERQAARSAR